MDDYSKTVRRKRDRRLVCTSLGARLVAAIKRFVLGIFDVRTIDLPVVLVFVYIIVAFLPGCG